jgi:hypothetical protein
MKYPASEESLFRAARHWTTEQYPGHQLAAVLLKIKGIKRPVRLPLPCTREEPVRIPRHSADFRSVNWFGVSYSFTALQAACVRVLWEAWENGTPEVSGERILESSDTDRDTRRIDTVFQNHPAWRTMIVGGSTKGTYQLCAPGDPSA